MRFCLVIWPSIIVLILAGCGAKNSADVYFSEQYKNKTENEIQGLTNQINKDNKGRTEFLKYNRGDLYAHIHRYHEALHDISDVKNTYGNNGAGYLGLLYEYMSNPEGCLEQERRAMSIRSKTDRGDLLFHEAAVLTLQGDFKHAEADVDLLLENGFKDSKKQYLTLKAFCQYKQGQCQKALQLVEQALVIDPRYCQALLLKGRLLICTGNLADAVQTDNELIASYLMDNLDRYISVGAGEPYRLRAEIYARLHNEKQATADLRMADLIDNQREVASVLSVAQAFAANGNSEVAVELCKQEVNRLNTALEAVCRLRDNLKQNR